MSVEENKAIARRFFEEVINQDNLDVFDELIATDYLHHDDPCAAFSTAEEYKESISRGRSSFPDVHLTIEDMIAEGDQVAVRGTGRGTHTRKIWGLAPTGKKWTIRWIYIARIADGKIIEGWMNQDRMGLRLQLEGKV